jgi:hypothetical protein
VEGKREPIFSPPDDAIGPQEPSRKVIDNAIAILEQFVVLVSKDVLRTCFINLNSSNPKMNDTIFTPQHKVFIGMHFITFAVRTLHLTLMFLERQDRLETTPEFCGLNWGEFVFQEANQLICSKNVPKNSVIL